MVSFLLVNVMKPRVSVKWLVLTNWLLGCSTSLSLSLHAGLRLRLWWLYRALYPRILGVITRPGTSETLPGSWHSWQESGTSSILLTSWRSEWSEDQWKQMRWATASTEIDVQSDIPVLVSVTPQHSQPISERLRASKYSRCITDLLFTLYRNPASQPHKHHNIPRNVFILIIRSAKCKCFCIIESIFQWITLLRRNWNVNSEKFWPG